jgi:hypothetical protein
MYCACNGCVDYRVEKRPLIISEVGSSLQSVVKWIDQRGYGEAFFIVLLFQFW